MGGPGWKNAAGWLTDAPLGEWFGVRTGTDGRVTALLLSNNGLQGFIPPEIGHLSRLEFLAIMHEDKLGGEIPPEIGGLANLRNLALSYTRLTGPIPVEITNLTNLTTLTLFHNLSLLQNSERFGASGYRGISRARRIMPGWTCHRGFGARRIRRASASALAFSSTCGRFYPLVVSNEAGIALRSG